MENLQQLYETTVSQLPLSVQLELASLILNRVTEAQRQQEVKSSHRLSVLDIIEGLPGGRIFKTSAEADAYLREERDSWER